KAGAASAHFGFTHNSDLALRARAVSGGISSCSHRCGWSSDESWKNILQKLDYRRSKGSSRLCSVLDIGQLLFPGCGKRNIFEIVVDLIDDGFAFCSWQKRFLFAFDITNCDELFNDSCTGGWCSQTALFHIGREVF